MMIWFAGLGLRWTHHLWKGFERLLIGGTSAYGLLL